MIETTRESAETAGTALKTVVARFSEVKKLYTQGDLLGTDEEGEEITNTLLARRVLTISSLILLKDGKTLIWFSNVISPQWPLVLVSNLVSLR